MKIAQPRVWDEPGHRSAHHRPGFLGLEPVTVDIEPVYPRDWECRRKKSSEARRQGWNFLATLADSWQQRPCGIPRLRAAKPRNVKDYSDGASNRSCAGLCGGAGRTLTVAHAVIRVQLPEQLCSDQLVKK
jgi:hypothetical protein